MEAVQVEWDRAFDSCEARQPYAWDWPDRSASVVSADRIIESQARVQQKDPKRFVAR